MIKTINLSEVEFDAQKISNQNESGQYCVGKLDNVDVYLDFPSPIMTVSESIAYTGSIASHVIKYPDEGTLTLTDRNADKIIKILKKSNLIVGNSTCSLEKIGEEDFPISGIGLHTLTMIANAIIVVKLEGKKNNGNIASANDSDKTT